MIIVFFRLTVKRRFDPFTITTTLNGRLDPFTRCSRKAATSCSWTSPPTTWTSTPCGRLEEALENFGGCAVVISHDRWFLDRIATHILAFEGNSQVVFFQDNWSEYEANRKKRLGVAAERPHRIKYRRLTRALDRNPV